MSQEKEFTFNYKVAVLENGLPKKVDGKTVKEDKKGVCKEIQFDNYLDALSYYEGKDPGKGEATIVSFLNDFLKNRAIATERASLTRGPSLTRTIKKAVDENTDFAAELAQLMNKYKLNVPAAPAV